MSDLSERVYTQLKKDLTEGVFPQDGLIIEQMLAERYNTSRTPVREAATRLVYEGYLKKYPKKGYTICCVGLDELKHLEESRFIIESGVIDLLIQKATDEEVMSLNDYIAAQNLPYADPVYANQVFHLQMAKLTGNAYLVDMLSSLLYKIARPIASSAQDSLIHFRQLAKDPNYVSPEHAAIVQEILARDAVAAKQTLREDICQIMPF